MTRAHRREDKNPVSENFHRCVEMKNMVADLTLQTQRQKTSDILENRIHETEVKLQSLTTRKHRNKMWKIKIDG